ncbi:MAG: ribosome assembly cofactor RimP [Tannerella sp.]|jgi:ribosome maturation factor RimP|nr:ribosome assembly cofactor RimP [Tannerella sp.]
MIDKVLIVRLVGEKIEGTGNYLVDVSISPDNVISVEIDNDKGVCIDDCMEISRHIEANLDRDKEDFELEVGSSGVTSPFKILRQYVKNIGNEVEMQLKSGVKYVGRLKAADESGATISVEKKIKAEGQRRKTVVVEDLKHTFDEINYTKYLIRF